MNRAQLSKAIKSKSLELGFSACGISAATYLEDDATRLRNWLNNNAHGEMQWMEKHFDLRCDPRKLLPGARSVISVLFNYAPENDLLSKGTVKIARYAYGKDYHKLLRKRLQKLISAIKVMAGDIEARPFVDSGPVLEKAWAARSGLGWIGKNGNLINKNMGSYFFIGEIITDLQLSYDGAVNHMCGSCTACIDACPTNAISEEDGVDGSRCISYFTIEKKGDIPEAYRDSFKNWVFGCDICQEVCPWQKFATPHHEPKLEPLPALMADPEGWWKGLNEKSHGQIFAGSAVKRCGYKGLHRNIAFITHEEIS